MASLDTFLARVLPRATGCEEPVARQAILDAAVEFCEETHVAQLVLDPFAATVSTPNYALALPVGTAIVQIEKAWYKTVPLNRAADALINNVLAYHDVAGTTRETGEPRDCFWHNNEFWVYPTPAATVAGALTVRASIKPADDATEVPDVLLTSWRDAVVAGALERVLGMRGTVHYDPAEAGKYAGKFRQAIADGRIRANTGEATSELSVRMRPFA